MLIRFGLGGQLSGSVGGVTAGHNKGGQYLRNRSIPTNPNTARQQQARTALATAASAWRNLSPEQRGNWESYATQTPLVNRLGESITVSGYNMYVRTNAFLFSLQKPGIQDAPVIPGQSIIPAIDATPSLTTAGLFDPGLSQDTELEYGGIFIGPAVSAGVSSFSGPYTLANASPTVMTFTGTLETTRYGDYQNFERRPFRLAGIDSDGRLSNVVEGFVNVTPGP